MDYIENLTSGISKRYLLKGRPGTGKSTLLRKLAAASAARGLNTEVYSCAFDSNSLDMIIWPELDKCLFDSTAPHLYEPSRPNDEVIDMYGQCVTPGTDEKYNSDLEDISARYKDAVQNGTAHLLEAKKQLDALMRIYTGAADQDEIQRVLDRIERLLRR
jgi:energy-coupling factor transporter ATP-binding protein EcfA2